MARLLCAANFASASVIVHTKTPPLFTNHGIHLTARLATARAWPTQSCSPPPLPVLRASSQELPTELLEDTKFVPINDDDPQYGPPAIMLMGLSSSEILKVQQLLQNMEGDFMKVLVCTNEMIKGTLWDAMHSSQPGLTEVKGAKGVPRICFLSGLTGEEIMMFVGALQDTDMEPVAFAAMVPNNSQKTLEELMEEIMGDHERLTQNS
eukprot:c18715_g1_i1 orf=167-790(+)